MSTGFRSVVTSWGMLLFWTFGFAIHGITGYGMLAALFRERVISRPSIVAWMRRGFAGAFVVLAAKLARVER
jgi:threonine/homoserine/homoserine lactone efflux protein